MKFKSLFKQGQSEQRVQLADTELELHKHFRLVRKLGRGSFATVYEAERLSDGQRYALKVTELNALSQLDKVAVVEEIRLLASLNHPNIIAYYEAFCDHDKLCVVTEIVQGGDLGSFVRKMADDEDFLWERQIWNLFLQAALGVQYLHRNHVLHRDLKPQNIMMTDKKGQGLLKIADLGVSAELARVFTNVQVRSFA
jgi:NIMA (never in mitosis gene a)-related kinase